MNDTTTRTTEYGTVERQPYAGDSDIVVVRCKNGDYVRLFKGAGPRGGPPGPVERQAEKALEQHYSSKHGSASVVHIGFTGTSGTVTPEQVAALRNLLPAPAPHAQEIWLHHGDCVGADWLAHQIAQNNRYRVHLHPPINTAKRAFCELDPARDTSEPPDEYRVRNLAIVESCDHLIAVVPGPEVQYPRSGSWMTVRMALRSRKPIILIYPDGTISRVTL